MQGPTPAEFAAKHGHRADVLVEAMRLSASERLFHNWDNTYGTELLGLLTGRTGEVF